MKELKILFENNLNWANSHLAKDPDYFLRMAHDQNPLYLWIGCSDSRVPANEIVGLEAGEIFVHRNVANLFPHTDFNCLSVLQYAVDYLRVKHIIVCGHYGCGGVAAAMSAQEHGLVDNWLRNIRDIYSNSKEELDAIHNPEERSNRLVELNVMKQVQNICHTTIVQHAWNRKQALWVHGWIYDMKSGRLHDLNCCVSGPETIDDIYRTRRTK